MLDTFQQTLPGTNMHFALFILILFEFVILSYQAIYLLSRPSDKSRVRYFYLVLLMLQYNVIGGIFIDPQLSIAVYKQSIIGNISGLIISIYLSYYIYKLLNIQEIKFLATYGIIVFLAIPYIIGFVIALYITKDIVLSHRITAILPVVYSVVLGVNLLKGVFRRWNTSDKHYKEKMVATTVTLLCWMSLPALLYFDANQLYEHFFTNSGFIIMTILFTRSSILESRSEYNQLLKSEKELKKLNETLTEKVKERTEELHIVNERRTTTFLKLAHEVKTPVTLLVNAIEDHKKMYGDNENIIRIKSITDRLISDISGFLDEEKISRGEILFNHNQITNLSKLSREIYDSFLPMANNKNIQFVEAIQEDLFIKADPRSIESIIKNLLDNSFKFTNAQKRITLKLSAKDNKVCLVVFDRGIGIPSNMHESVFEPFSQEKEKDTENYGIGVGLSLVKAIANELNAEISLDSYKNKGTLVRIDFEKYNGNIEDLEKTSTEDIRKYNLGEGALKINSTLKNKKMTILIVEDNPELLILLINSFKDKYNVLSARNGKEGLEVLENVVTPDLILSDVVMEGMDGYEFFKIISESKQYKHIHRLFITAQTGLKNKLKGLELGAYDVIFKPFEVSELVMKVDSIMQNIVYNKQAIITSATKFIERELKAPVTETVVPDREEQFRMLCETKNISVREREIIELIIKGKSNKEIANCLNVASNTVSTHIYKIYGKIGINSRTELVYFFNQNVDSVNI